MSNKQRYKKAARQIAEGKERLCCYSIYRNSSGTALINKFLGMFEPKTNNKAFFYGSFNPKNQLARSLALLFMAEMETK